MDIEFDLKSVVRELDFESMTEISFKSSINNLYEMEGIKLDLPTFSSITSETTKMMI